MPDLRIVAPALASFVFFVAPDASAGQQKFTTDYSITFLGLPVARASFTAALSADGSLEINGNMRGVGLTSLLGTSAGTTQLTGRLNGAGNVEPSRFSIEYQTRGRPDGVSVRFDGGSAVAVNHRRPAPQRRSTYIPITADHLRSVTDPLSATIVRAPSPQQVCERAVRLFDGWMRADLKLSPVSTGPLPNHPGTGAVCAGRYTPIAGFNSDNRDLHFIRDSGAIRVTFAPLEGTDIYAPVHASIGTRVGSIHVTAGPIRAH